MKALWTVFFTTLFLTSTTYSAQNTAESIPGEYVVRLRDSRSLKAEKARLEAALQGTIKRTIPSENIVVLVRPSFELVDSALQALAQNPLVAIAEPNYIYHANKTPDDPMLSQLWGLKNIGQVDSQYQSGKAGVDISAEKAWDIETGSKDVIVAVIDSGVDLQHPDLKDNLWINEVEARGVVDVDDDNNGYVDDINGYNFSSHNANPQDDFAHGSHCAGVIGAHGNDGAGVVGVNWNVRIMPVKILNDSGSGSLDSAIEGVVYATKMGARIMSNSWGGSTDSENLRLAIENAHNAGALFVVAAGNNTANNDVIPTYPASYDLPNILAVAAVDNKGDLAEFSNFGKKSVHVGAPGVNILSTVPGGGYFSWSGTSMATPHVAGVAALLAAHEPQLTNVQIKERIMNTATPIDGLIGMVKGRGLVNAYAALTNTVAPANPNDPAFWKTYKISISSPHPYKENSKESYSIEVPGAKQIAIQFDRLQTENLFDKIQIYDSKGKLVDSQWGLQDGLISKVITGNKAKVVLNTDKARNAYGFDITKVFWR